MIKQLILFALLAYVTAAPTSLRDDDERPKPYSFTIDSTDEFGNTITRTETGDESGTVRGSYSYRDVDGVYRIADYVSDEGGFRVSVRTNEPGTGKHENGDPADTTFEIEEPPPAVVAKYADAGSAAARPSPSRG